MERDFQVKVSSDSRGTVLGLQGELDISSSSVLENELDAVNGSSRVIVDLSELEFIDSTGLGLLVKAHQQMREAGNEFVLLGGEGQVKRLLELTGLEGQLTLIHSLDEMPPLD